MSENDESIEIGTVHIPGDSGDIAIGSGNTVNGKRVPSISLPHDAVISSDVTIPPLEIPALDLQADQQDGTTQKPGISLKNIETGKVHVGSLNVGGKVRGKIIIDGKEIR